MSIEFTYQSAIEYENIVYGNMTPAMAADYLRNGRIIMRNFADTLRDMYPAPDLVSRLTDFFLDITPDAAPPSISKKIRNWLSGKNRPNSRNDIFCIAFALRLSEQQLNYLLCLCTDYRIQYRDSYELILAWFLRNGYDYQDALQFYFSLPPVGELNLARTKKTSHLTQEMRAEFQVICTLEDLKKYYLKNQHHFGCMHLRAYYYFDKFLNQLICPIPCWENNTEANYSLETVMQTYLSLNVPSGRKRTDYNIVQKLLKQNWPSATSIKNIRNHKEDVPRKLLLLLYVVTENESSDPDFYRELDEDYIPLEDRVEYHWWTLNAILDDCGMAPLDPRNAADWLILYAISCNAEESMSERLEQVMAYVFDT
ncbi:MAG: hypothetical protein NC314_03585 [Roseburia sp.]|nr:hypothetical protein [Roseburia sp.]MCM1241897.1 hypothetical protein [Roseburia sp.]